ncbi:MAG: 3-isopropylmalate dehydratase large subunit [Candidatus Korarchaeum sp.]|nr:3-isopropylmalate dehydratase large subunit [Candidatus Korarchaeum sp.]MDW8035688.1 3-isopropylmalate dehydratase large subunit [Candidatus Korarchaeum sp.]
MAMTIVEKILSLKVGRQVSPGDHVVAPVDLVYAHDGTAPLAIEVMERLGIKELKGRSVFTIDHASPPHNVDSASIHMKMRSFASRWGVRLFDVGEGICHQVIPESGMVRPWDLVVGADSHTVTLGALGALATGVGSTDAAIAMMTGKIWLKVPESIAIRIDGELRSYVTAKDVILDIIGRMGSDGANYKAVEFLGSTVESMSVDSKMVLANMSVEMGAKAGLVPTDSKTLAWLRERVAGEVREVRPDEGANYSSSLELSASEVKPNVSLPGNVDKVVPVEEVEGEDVQLVLIGSCSGGRFEDFLSAARIMRGRRRSEGTRCIAIPASKEVYRKLVNSGLMSTLLEFGCLVGPPTCGPCIGAHMGLAGPGEMVISTSTRNFPGRMGSPDSRVYLASPLTAAASATAGKLTDPRRFLT